MKMAVFFYMVFSLILGLGAIIIAVFEYLSSQDQRIKRFIWFLGAYMLTVGLINIDFFLRSLFMVQYSFIYFKFYYLLLMYAIGLLIYAFSGFIFELATIMVPKAFKWLLFGIVFLPLYLLIPVMILGTSIDDLYHVFLISGLEIMLVMLAAVVILFIKRKRLLGSWKKAAYFLIGFLLSFIPFYFSDLILGNLKFLNPNWPDVSYFTIIFYSLFNLAVILKGMSILIRKAKLRNNETSGFEKVIPTEIADIYGISEREKEIAGAILEGKTNREIAAEKYISETTVKKHIYNLFQKTGARNRVELINILHHK